MYNEMKSNTQITMAINQSINSFILGTSPYQRQTEQERQIELKTHYTWIQSN